MTVVTDGHDVDDVTDGRAAEPARLNPDGRAAVTIIVTVVGTLTGAAFVLSFAALRDVAEAANVAPQLSWLWPLVVDGSIVVNTTAAMVLRSRGEPTLYPWASVAAAAVVSFLANAVHPTGHGSSLILPPLLALLVGGLPPIALLQTTHLGVRLLVTGGTVPDPSTAPRTAVEPQRPAPAPEPMPREPDALPAIAAEEPATPQRADTDPSDLGELVKKATAAGERVTGATVARWLGVSESTGLRRLKELQSSSAEE